MFSQNSYLPIQKYYILIAIAIAKWRELLVRLKFQPLEKEQALAIINWRYTSTYNYYNFDADNFHEDLCYLLDPANAFYAILSLKGDLEGFCSFGKDGQVPGGNYTIEALDIGMGIRPDLTGQKYGEMYAQAVVEYGANQYEMQKLRVTIAKFKKRAQRVWEKLGFNQLEEFIKIGSEEKFVIMTR